MSDNIIRQIMQQEPNLTDFGFGTFNEWKLSKQEYETKFQRGRVSMLELMSLIQFEKARVWLSKQKKTKHINLNTSSSYGLKHVAEKDIGYITNGMFIAAAIAEGFDIQKAGSNAYFNISRKLIAVNVMDC